MYLIKLFNHGRNEAKIIKTIETNTKIDALSKAKEIIYDKHSQSEYVEVEQVGTTNAWYCYISDETGEYIEDCHAWECSDV